MRLKITLTLFAILLGLLTYIFYIDDRSLSGDAEEERSSVLGDLAVGIDYLSLQNNANGQTITLQLENNRWMIKEPYLWPANEFAVQKILTELRFLERISSFETNVFSNSGVALPDYGLKPSQMALMIGRGEKRSTIHIGKPTEIGNNLYILSTDQSHIHVVNRSLLDAISANLETLRSKRLFDIAVFQATAWNIQVSESNRNLRTRAWFTRNGDNWSFETPISARADSAAVNGLLNRCLALEADSIVAPNPTDLSPYGLQNPLYRIAIEADQNREVLEIGEKISPDSEFRYAKRERRPSVFQLRIDFLEDLANAQTTLRERRIFEIDVTAATTVTIERRDHAPLSLQKLEDENWEIFVRDQSQGLQTIEGDTATINEILKWLDQLKAVPDTGFVNDAPSGAEKESYGVEVPEYSIAITSNRRYGDPTPLDNNQTEVLLIGDRTPRDKNESFIKIQSKDFVYAAYNDIFERIDENPLRYKSRQVIDLPANARIQRLAIERLADKATIIDATFDPANTAEVKPQAATLANLLNALTIESYNIQGFTRTVEIAGRNRPWAYRLEATIQTGSGAEATSEKIELFISETTGGPLLYGGIPTRNLGFRFQLDFIDAFSDIVFDRVPRPTPEAPFSTTPLPTVTPAAPASETLINAEPLPPPANTTE